MIAILNFILAIIFLLAIALLGGFVAFTLLIAAMVDDARKAGVRNPFDQYVTRSVERWRREKAEKETPVPEIANPFNTNSSDPTG